MLDDLAVVAPPMVQEAERIEGIDCGAEAWPVGPSKGKTPGCFTTASAGNGIKAYGTAHGVTKSSQDIGYGHEIVTTDRLA
jgi:hypothetical protein